MIFSGNFGSFYQLNSNDDLAGKLTLEFVFIDFTS